MHPTVWSSAPVWYNNWGYNQKLISLINISSAAKSFDAYNTIFLSATCELKAQRRKNRSERLTSRPSGIQATACIPNIWYLLSAMTVAPFLPIYGMTTSIGTWSSQYWAMTIFQHSSMSKFSLTGLQIMHVWLTPSIHPGRCSTIIFAAFTRLLLKMMDRFKEIEQQVLKAGKGFELHFLYLETPSSSFLCPNMRRFWSWCLKYVLTLYNMQHYWRTKE